MRSQFHGFIPSHIDWHLNQYVNACGSTFNVELIPVSSGFAVVMAEAPSEAAKEQAAVIPGMFQLSSPVLVQTAGID